MRAPLQNDTPSSAPLRAWPAPRATRCNNRRARVAAAPAACDEATALSSAAAPPPASSRWKPG